MSVCYGEKESGGTSCFNDDRVIGLRNLVTERDVTERARHPLNTTYYFAY